MNIKTLDELNNYINEDLKIKEARIVRFVNVESLTMWVKVKSFLNDKCTKTIRLSDYCEDDDLTPNINRMINALKKINEHTLIIPLSEHLRINNTEADGCLERILKTEFINDVDEKGVRVFIPIYRMRNKLKGLIDKDPRYRNHIIFLETGQDDDYALTIVSNDIDANIEGNNLQGYKDYLKYWEENPSKPIILHTANAKYYADIIFSDNVKVLITAYDLLKYHYHLSEAIKEVWGSEWQWRELLVRMKTNLGLKGVFEYLFNIPMYSCKNLLSRWSRFTDFERWAAWLWSKLEGYRDYLSIVLNDNCNLDNFVEKIINSIFLVNFKKSEYKEYYFERKEYIVSLAIENLPTSFWDELSRIKVEERLYYLTDCTSKEQNEILSIINSEGFNEKTRSVVGYVYPKLDAYAGDHVFEDERFTYYFTQYKAQKIENKVDERFIEVATKFGADKGIWRGLETRNKIIDDIYNSDSIIYWIDALGVEYLNFIKYILKNNYTNVFYNFRVGYANIPTITECNNDFLRSRNSATPFRKLDKAKHDLLLEYPKYIPNEFELIEEALKEAVSLLDSHDKVIIVSDHGASRLAVMAQGQTHKAQESAKVERHGRYCVDATNHYGDEFAGCIDEGEYHVFADYDRFSISGAAKPEIHGGASLEEVLVPIIELSKKPFDVEDIPKLIAEEIKQKAGQKVTVKFKLAKDYDSLYAVIGSQRYKCIKEADFWYFQPDVDKKDIYKAKIVSNRTLGTIEYKVIKGISSNFDI